MNFCWVSAARKGVVDPNCVTDNSTLYAYVDATRVSHKFVRQFFNPATILETGLMEYIGEQRMESDFAPTITPSNNFLVAYNSITFYNNKGFDFSSFGSFSFLQIPSYDFYATEFSSSNLYTNFQTDPSYGLYTWAMGQNPKVLSSDVTLLSFDQTLALMGGYAGTVWLILGFFIGGF